MYQEAPVPNIPEVPPGPAPSGAQQAQRSPVVKGAKRALAPAALPGPDETGGGGDLTPEQLQIVQIVLQDPMIMTAIANALGVGQRPEQILFGG